ncbi:hypothetical protein Pcinc_038230 [Petrolisthes cinctipes]|uniref:Uncharacterized protein n=1 Tax=Petrolisthes cinctipes TaxID=88211 RepID=A0AAE1BS14_PETCI|nr:hypothetical protein Pcinc_038230 [Petrolisthes cinctipes]
MRREGGLIRSKGGRGSGGEEIEEGEDPSEARQYLSGGALPANTPRRATSTSTLPPLHLSWHSLGLCCDLQVPPRAMYTLLARPLHLTKRVVQSRGSSRLRQSSPLHHLN